MTWRRSAPTAGVIVSSIFIGGPFSLREAGRGPTTEERIHPPEDHRRRNRLIALPASQLVERCGLRCSTRRATRIAGLGARHPAAGPDPRAPVSAPPG